jgi:hypothetical protein
MSTPQTRLSMPASAAAGTADVLLAGAGISGTGAGYRLKTGLPGKAFHGGRSDSDPATVAYQIKPWTRDSYLFWIPAGRRLRQGSRRRRLGPGVRALRAGQVQPARSPDPAQLVPGQPGPRGEHRR